MTLRLLLALALLPLAACADSTDTTATDDVAVVTDDAVMGDDILINEDATLDDSTMTDGMVATNDVTAQGTLDAVEAVDAWIAKLDGNAAAAPVVEGLNTLKGQLTATPIDGAAIGATLVSLGGQTTAAAGGDTALEALGGALTSTGNTLMGN